MLPVQSIELRRFLGSLFLLAGAQFVDASTALVSARAIWDDETKEIVVVLDGHLDGTIVKEIDIGELVRGVNPTLRFRFENRLGSDLTFTQVKVECSCTATRIPNELVPQGSQLVGEVDLAIGKQEKNLTRTFGLEIDSNGAADRVLLRLKGRIKNVVAFPRYFYSVSIDEDTLRAGSKVVWTSPLVVSDDACLEKARLRASGDLACKVTLSLNKKEKPIARLEIVTRDLPSSGTADVQVALEGEGFPTQMVSVSFRIRKTVSLLPSALFFSSTDIDQVEASALVRVTKKKSETDLLSLIRVVLESGEEIEGKLVSVGREVWRLDLKGRKEGLAANRGTVKDTKVTLMLGQESVELSVRSSFKWKVFSSLSSLRAWSHFP